MPGPVGGDFYTKAAIANYTSMYEKSVENVVLKKTFSTYINQAKTPNESKPVLKEEVEVEEKQPPKPTKDIIEEIVGEEIEIDLENETKVIETEILKPNKTVPEEPDVFSANYDSFFNKDVNVTTMDIIKNLSTSKANDIMEKAAESFPGDVMLSDQVFDFAFLPDKELYIRWLQLATFLPVIRFTYLPSKYKDDSVLELAKSLTALRAKTVSI